MDIETGNTLWLVFSIFDQMLTEMCGKISGQQ